ncbi:hypothetical protein PPTG_22443 [Phytophthora nicotianae INRA-310]|uniref:Uncharacterized protein n=2 Tax=Phytophthora nicotianae TaxID=4792 RepID=W2QKD7_PHYN3|nr:hypothetical protein PPTG_22443 [Phytophthora nicotianae INRA-310]ETI52057.1 hypothetical protein F443_04708 [Phytophthora nicotianae P1569]ETN13009.1 hypothetical protein PPTG_22443 [Phytophthora nicotianae INRA-310]
MKKVGTRISHAVAAGWRFLMSQFFHSKDRMNVHESERLSLGHFFLGKREHFREHC